MNNKKIFNILDEYAKAYHEWHKNIGYSEGINPWAETARIQNNLLSAIGRNVIWHDGEIEETPLNEPLAIMDKNSQLVSYWLTFYTTENMLTKDIYWLRKNEFFVPPLPKKKIEEADPIAIAKKIMEEDENVSLRAHAWAKYGEHLLDVKESHVYSLIHKLLTYVYVFKFME